MLAYAGRLRGLVLQHRSACQCALKVTARKQTSAVPSECLVLERIRHMRCAASCQNEYVLQPLKRDVYVWQSILFETQVLRC